MKPIFLKNLFLVTVFLLAVFFLVNQSSIFKPKDFHDIKQIEIAGQSIKVDLALTDAEKTKGLSGRKELKENEGMLFVFDKQGKYPFWMKDMNFPIDIIWIGEDMKVVYIEKDAQPELFPETYGSDTNAKYVLEVVSGFSSKNNLKEGDSIKFP